MVDGDQGEDVITGYELLKKAAGLEGFPFRNLRHTGASLAIAAGANPLLVAARLGGTSTEWSRSTTSLCSRVSTERSGSSLTRSQGARNWERQTQ